MCYAAIGLVRSTHLWRLKTRCSCWWIRSCAEENPLGILWNRWNWTSQLQNATCRNCKRALIIPFHMMIWMMLWILMLLSKLFYSARNSAQRQKKPSWLIWITLLCLTFWCWCSYRNWNFWKYVIAGKTLTFSLIVYSHSTPTLYLLNICFKQATVCIGEYWSVDNCLIGKWVMFFSLKGWCYYLVTKGTHVNFEDDFLNVVMC